MSGTQIGNIDLVKQMNSAVVYRLIDKHESISRIQVAEKSQLAPASVTKITRQLLKRGLIKEVAHQESTGGRRAISLTTEKSKFHTLAIRLGREDIELALYDFSSACLVSNRYSFHYQTPQQLTQELIQHIEIFLKEQINTVKELIAIGLVLPGLINPEAGIIDYMPNIEISQFPLAQYLQDHFSVSCFIGNDIRGLALAEHYFGTTQDCQDSIVVSIYQGTGAGIIVNGKVFLGHKRNVGEIGHIQVDPLGKRCHCGNFGCLETIASEPAIISKVKQHIAQGYPTALKDAHHLDIKTICEYANQGDPFAKQLLTHVGEQIGKVLAMTVNVFNPQKIAIAGDIVHAKSIVFNAIDRSIKHQALHAFQEELVITQSQLYTQPTMSAFALIKRAILDGSLLQTLLAET